MSSSLPAELAIEPAAQATTMIPVAAQRRRSVSPIRASVWVLDMPLLRSRDAVQCGLSSVAGRETPREVRRTIGGGTAAECDVNHKSANYAAGDGTDRRRATGDASGQAASLPGDRAVD